MPTPVPTLSVSERALLRVDTIVRKYRIVRLLGIGGMAAVYAATHRNGHRVAIKFLLERYRDDAEVLELFSREAYAANRVGHPGAVPVLDDDVDDNGCPFLVMPLLQGESIRARWERENKRLPVAEVGVITAEVLAVLDSAHANGVVHRDIKPDNLFITNHGEVRVLDFGIARRTDGDATATLTGRLVGTPAFMPPEQAAGNRLAIGPHSDLWAVGATMFALLSGEFVHQADNAMAHYTAAATRPARSLAEAAPELPQAIVDFVDRTLAFDPGERWHSAREMREALLAVVEGTQGEPAATITARVRKTFSAPPSDLDVTQARETNPRPELGARIASSSNWPVAEMPLAPPDTPRPVKRVEGGIEVRAAGSQLSAAFRLAPSIAHRILVKHGLGRFSKEERFMLDLRNWWPLDAYLATLHEISEAVGPAKMVEIGRRIARLSAMLPSMHDMQSTLASLDAAYHLNHRRDGAPMYDVKSERMIEGIGHARYLGESGPSRASMEWDTPYPCDMDRGILLGFARRYARASFIEHSPDQCRKEGAASCLYHVCW